MAIDSVETQLDTVPAPQVPDTVVVVQTDTIVMTDTIVQTDTVVMQQPEKVKAGMSNQPKPASSAKSNGKLNLSYGNYAGDIKDGYPDGMGRLTYSTSRVINKYDSKSRSASVGDYVVGEFVRGFFVQGKHYNSNGDLIETIMVGVPASNNYDSK